MADLLLALCIPDFPASFRNAEDAKEWRQIVTYHHGDRLQREFDLFQSNAVTFPVACPVALRIIHLHCGKATKKDVDNTAKPIMDAFSSLVYKDDSQVKSLSFISAPIFSKLADAALGDNDAFLAGSVYANLLRPGVDVDFDDITLIEVRDITSEMEETASDHFGVVSKSAVRERFETS